MPLFCQSEKSDTDIICDSFTLKKKQDLCDEGMEHVLREKYHVKNARLGSFLKKKSLMPVHESAKSFSEDPYTCQRKTVSGRMISTEKPMYYCTHRVYKNQRSEELQISGFFVSGAGRGSRDTAFMFLPESLLSKNVRPYAKLWDFERDLDRRACE